MANRGRTVFGKSNVVKGCIDERFQLKEKELNQLLHRAERNPQQAIEAAFRYGYIKGGRAERAKKYTEHAVNMNLPGWNGGAAFPTVDIK